MIWFIFVNAYKESRSQKINTNCLKKPAYIKSSGFQFKDNQIKYEVKDVK